MAWAWLILVTSGPICATVVGDKAAVADAVADTKDTMRRDVGGGGCGVTVGLGDGVGFGVGVGLGVAVGVGVGDGCGTFPARSHATLPP